MKYKLNKDSFGQTISVNCQDQNISIPFAPDNTDYIRFKTDLYNGIELQDPDGNTMTPEQVQEFLSTLP